MLGYFSIIGLLRVHVLLGDFTLALKVMENIEMNQKVCLGFLPTFLETKYYYQGILHPCYCMPCCDILLRRVFLYGTTKIHRCDSNICLYIELHFPHETISYSKLPIRPSAYNLVF